MDKAVAVANLNNIYTFFMDAEGCLYGAMSPAYRTLVEHGNVNGPWQAIEEPSWQVVVGEKQTKEAIFPAMVSNTLCLCIKDKKIQASMAAAGVNVPGEQQKKSGINPGRF